MKIEPFNVAMYQQVAEIYQEGLATGMATFETEVPDWEKWDNKFLKHSRLVLSKEGQVNGWAALSAVSTRKVYEGVAEVTIYLSKTTQGKGYGKLLLKALIESSENNGIWSLQSSIFPQNKASIHLHLNCGFRQIGYKEKIAQRDGLWQDNVLLEKRSEVIGI
ncbi:N-acetyltransferase family protein [Jiulongibacter sp. NS-SX5]|uniref:N-acetyltransferase family protein n=1 Tax=Jiulongibacter sp. NS-SX5 TaxID=3463854 RepID=UPI004059C3B9